ncbi:hypothetical protein [Actinacidiphila oryziradicis]|uniref:Uncharacterized protein n=1 Tax=Actinacidiphila oryziradicis TaxID=2571141 RepID=A0A4U0ST07_9ACTN|nr:hypothetical protein [Actinacidiphila oryziradicis]TKA13192.1 hypothetical protein FCI23_00140 [Actinacidiphila oryziradicis]
MTNPVRTPIHEGPPATDAEFDRLRYMALAQLAGAPPKTVTEKVKKKGNKVPKMKVAKRKTVGAKETAPKAKKAKRLAENVDSPAAPVADPWTQRAVDLWPTDSLRTWEPSAPMSLSDYLKDGI